MKELDLSYEKWFDSQGLKDFEVSMTPNPICYSMLPLSHEAGASDSFLVLRPTHSRNTEAHSSYFIMYFKMIFFFIRRTLVFYTWRKYLIFLYLSFSFYVMVPGINSIPGVIFSEYQLWETRKPCWWPPKLSDLPQ